LFGWFLAEVYPGLQADRVAVEDRFREHLASDYASAALGTMLAQYRGRPGPKGAEGARLRDRQTLLLSPAGARSLT